MKQAGVTADQTAYIGDDSVDLPALQPVAFLLLWQTLHLMCKMPWIMYFALGGGKGAFREMSDMILHAPGQR